MLLCFPGGGEVSAAEGVFGALLHFDGVAEQAARAFGFLTIAAIALHAGTAGLAAGAAAIGLLALSLAGAGRLAGLLAGLVALAALTVLALLLALARLLTLTLLLALALVWALGVVLYELLTGRVPFEGPVAVVLHRICAPAASAWSS